jgi:aarF domain-containing kinase
MSPFLGDIRIGEILTETMSIVRDHQVRIEPDFTNLVVSIMVLEGLGRQLNPEVDLFRAALPVLRQELSKNKGWPVFMVWFGLEIRYVIASFTPCIC